jgi:hypothetical protein
MRALALRVLRSRWLHGGVLVTVALFGLIGFAHTEAGRPLLNALRGAPGCPVDLAALEPANVEAKRVEALARKRGVAIESSRRALGFTLGETTRADVGAYLSAHGVACTAKSESALHCASAPGELSPGGAPRIDDLHLQFDQDDRLVAVDVYREGTSSCAAVAWLTELDGTLSRDVGPATGTTGEVSESFLESGSLRRAAHQYRYRGYIAEVSATRFGTRGVRIREQYQWLPGTSSAGG